MTARKQKILDIAVRDWPNVSARAIARELKTAHSAVIYHFGDSTALKHAAACEAIRVGDKRVVPMLITGRHAAAATLSEDARRLFLSMVD